MAEMRYISPDGGPPLGGISPQDLAFLQPFHIPPFVGYPFTAQNPPPGPPPAPASVPTPPELRGQVFLHQTFTTNVPPPAAAPMAPAPAPAQAPNTSPPAAQTPSPARPPAAIPGLARRLPSGAYPPDSERAMVLPTGQGYIFPKKHTTLHIIETSTAPWDNPGGIFQWRSYRVPSSMAVSELVDQLCPTKTPDGRDVTSRGIVECLEIGDGTWLKGSEFWVGGRRGGDDNMKRRVTQSLTAVGWTELRGTVAQPVWITMNVAV
ncbi:hypothetical protein MGYG_00590 [Nannizzia gypsea CBS 118893]|uniref:Uncharacterized protein n=1 Tax=Arthroderma gypseum (strain ATCC MYA-4604 / CBS 118893) TaxID=535722 RepID=E5R0P3_ARTGP|nr:hypothetical protein MGYG_00590 [Nannizzia gypsea CBS 118893]EFQ97549.1 hypothetical protein MGYG_00590 [Nannizzia gypsea CBS 118893]